MSVLKHGCFYVLFPDKAVRNLQVSVLNLAESRMTWEMGLWALLWEIIGTTLWPGNPGL